MYLLHIQEQIYILPLQPINTLKQLAFENGNVPVSSFSNTFKKVTEASTDPSLIKIAQTYQTHYNFSEAFHKASKGKIVMGESGSFLEYNIRKSFTNKYKS